MGVASASRAVLFIRVSEERFCFVGAVGRLKTISVSMQHELTATSVADASGLRQGPRGRALKEDKQLEPLMDGLISRASLRGRPEAASIHVDKRIHAAIV